MFDEKNEGQPEYTNDVSPPSLNPWARADGETTSNVRNNVNCAADLVGIST